MAPSRGYALSLALLWLGAALFARSYFPAPSPSPSSAARTVGFAHDGPFDRLVWVLVDALRSDLAFEPGRMPFLQSLLHEGTGLGFTARAQAPTVTLPRLKALLTGASPSFLDAVLNLAESSSDAPQLASADTWLHRLRHRADGSRRRIAFAGDDTWLRLFPRDWFTLADGVSSFFVSDTVVVDANVTRHLPELLDADIAILHYLGVDHAGHLSGPNGSLMAAKLLEMDAVVERLWQHLVARDAKDGQRTLLVVLGDHGMTAAGNHGGASAGETRAALLLASPLFFGSRSWPVKADAGSLDMYHAAQQVDIVPTLAALFGTNQPARSCGLLLEPVLDALQDRLLVDELRRLNVEHLRRHSDASFDSGDDPVAARHSQQLQSALLSAFDVPKLLDLLPGLGLMLLAVAIAVRFARPRPFACVIMSVYAALMFASSFIEEEHEIWFYAVTTAVLLQLRHRSTRSITETRDVLLLACSLRLMRQWSFNGQKLGEPRGTVSFALSLNPGALWLAIAASCSSLIVFSPTPNRLVASMQVAVLIVWLIVRDPTAILPAASEPIRTAITRKLLGDRVVTARLVYAAGLGGLVARPSSIISTATVVLASLAKSTSVPLFGLVLAQLQLTRRIGRLDPTTEALLHVGAQHCAFYASGGSMSLATVDLSQAYNGLRSYRPAVVALLTLLSNFGLPLVWSLADPLPSSFGHRAAFHCLALLALASSATIMRAHLFVLTGPSPMPCPLTLAVFSPALLYRAVWSLGILSIELVRAGVV